jgi:hypothetical protein
MPSRVAKYGIEFNFFAASGGRIVNPPHENQVYEIWRRYCSYFVFNWFLQLSLVMDQKSPAESTLWDF